MTEIEVFAQADILNVRTTLVPVSQASTLETMLLKAIQAGAEPQGRPARHLRPGPAPSRRHTRGPVASRTDQHRAWYQP